MGLIEQVPGGVVLARTLRARYPLDPADADDFLAAVRDPVKIDVVGEVGG